MEVLHILRSEPEETVKKLMAPFTGGQEKTTPLYEPDVDWETLVDDIFASDKVISWW
ncbi:MAG: hypothetical protein R6V54_14080 [Desulfobacteraceae bacterium]